MGPEDRKRLDDALFERLPDVDPDTGFRPPPGFSEDEMAASMASFIGVSGRR